MLPHRIMLVGLVFAGFCGAVLTGLAQAVSDYAVQVSASVQTDPPRITLSWPADPNVTGYTLYRKSRDDASWSNGTVLISTATNYLDSNVLVGSAFEYRVSKSAIGYSGQGYIYAGIEVPLAETRGKLILLVDASQAASLAPELARLQEDLVGDGWRVLRHDVPRQVVDPANTSSAVWSARSNEVANIKSIVTNNFLPDPANVKALFLIGHVPVPYSGNLNPDGHPDHLGAWAADVFYGEMNGAWGDSSVNASGTGDARTINVPGDGKFDRTSVPTDMELQVGRVDFANLPAFALSETELLRRYLNKDHAFRHRMFTASERGLIDDNFGLSTGEPFAVNGWRSFAACFGASNTIPADWLTVPEPGIYLFGYGCGGGTYTSCSGVADITQLATSDPRIVFTMLFGSYFGDWDSQNNLLRGALATPTYTLTSVWAGRPNWQFHHMALGETIGFSTRLSQNNNGVLYDANISSRRVHMALMGDPTLRLHMVAPPSFFVAKPNVSGGTDLQWNASPDSVVGYHVYRATNVAGPFTRISGQLVTGTNYVDPQATTNIYMVRAVNLEEAASGSYYNASQGIFLNYRPLPLLTITAQSTNKIYGAPLPPFQASYSGFLNGDSPDDLDSPPLLSTMATSNSPAGNYPIHVTGAADTNYAITFVDGILTISRASTAGLVISSNNPSVSGQSVVFGMTVTAVAPGTGFPTGLVQFRIDGESVGEPAPLDAGISTYSTAALSHGWHSVEAVYAGDENFLGTNAVMASAQLVNAPPVAGDDTIERDPNNGVKVSITNLLSNDSDADADPIVFLGADAASANGGTVVSNTGCLFYTPSAGFTNVDTFTYRVTDGFGMSATGLVTVNVRNDPPAELAIKSLGNASYQIRGEDVPERAYRIQYIEELGTTNWHVLGTATGDASGIFLLFDSTQSTQRFYRSLQP